MGTEGVPKKEESDSSEIVSELERKIIRQVEYYFGNFNLCKDKFLREQIKVDDGWVLLETLGKFNRLKTLSEDHKVICDALKKSTNDLMEINEDSTKIRRRPEKPLPPIATTRDEMDGRTLYVKGFKKTVTLDELLDYFREYNAEHIYMRQVRPPNKGFKGSCFVIFETLEDAEKFLELKGIKFQGTELLREKKKDYVKRKDVYYDNLRKEKEKKQLKKTEDTKKDAEVPDIQMIPGCLLKFTGLTSEVIREDLKEPMEKYGNVVFVDYFKGKPEGVVRFETGVAATALEEACSEEDGVRKMQIRSVKATVSLIDGDEEKEYWKNIAVSRANSKLRHAEFQRQNKGRFGKNRNWGKRSKRPNRNDESEDQAPSKRTKTEANGEEKKNNQEASAKTEAPMEQTAS